MKRLVSERKRQRERERQRKCGAKSEHPKKAPDRKKIGVRGENVEKSVMPVSRTKTIPLNDKLIWSECSGARQLSPWLPHRKHEMSLTLAFPYS